MKNTEDLSYLEMAYSLARRAESRVSPNPYVGAVIVKGRKIIGHGFHKGPGYPHAEIVALQQAGSEARNATAFITLEPCVHWGRTPPCVDSIIEAGLRRVVISALDPNPLVYRKGIKRMKEAGIDTSFGLLEEKNERLNEKYIKYITQKIPFVTIKAASTMDGRIATRSSDSRWISSPMMREYIHLLRGEYDALAVGIQTLIMDDPLLSIRHPEWRKKKIDRVILDSSLRFPMNARMTHTLSQGKILVFTSRKASSKKREALEKTGIEVIPVRSSARGLSLPDILSHLGSRTVSSLLVEGGSRLVTSFLEQKLADKIVLTLSPKLVGGRESLSFFVGKGADSLREARTLKNINFIPLDEEMIVEGYF